MEFRWGSGGERWSTSDQEFEAMVREVEERARAGDVDVPEDDLTRMVQDAIDELPGWVREELDRHVSVIVADDGFSPETYGHADSGYLYGLYQGRGIETTARIVIFRDTLTADFPDPADLERQVVTTLRHEVAHHLGADERHVESLGL